jgi:multidrug efflux system membrane fusion protein
VDEGNIVHASDANGLVVLTQLKPATVVFTLPEEKLGAVVAQQQQSPLDVTAMSQDGQTKLADGKLLLVDNVIDATTGTMKLKAVFGNDDLKLWPGEFVNARLLVDVRKNGVVVPAPVVQRGPQGTFAFVIKDDSTVDARPIEVAQIEQGLALIKSGLSVGEQVVTDGQYKLQAGSKVTVQQQHGGGGQQRGTGGSSNGDATAQDGGHRHGGARTGTP